MPADLHTHTNFSDGLMSPKDLVEQAKNVGLTQMAVTDHDEVAGLPEAIETGKRLGVRVIPGIEISTYVQGFEMHLLGYFINFEDVVFRTKLADLQSSRRDRIRQMVAQLRASGVSLNESRVFELAGDGSAGRPHVARALVEQEFAVNLRDAFDRFLTPGRSGYVAHSRLTPAQAILLITKVGGVPVLAHPGVSGGDEAVPELVALGLRGIEAYYGSYRPDQVKHYEQLAEKYGLCKTGGSDYHGEGGSARAVQLGDVKLPDRIVEIIEEEAVRARSSRVG